MKQNLSRASKERITRIKPREKKVDDENCGVFERKVKMSDVGKFRSFADKTS